MIGNISNIDELHAERERLRSQLREMELDIKHDVAAIERSWKPVITEAFSAGKNVVTETRASLMNQMLGLSVGMGLDLLITRVVMKNSSVVAKTVVSIVVQNGVPLLFGSRTAKLMSRIKGFFYNKKEDQP